MTETQPQRKMHDSDLSGEVDLLHFLLDDAKGEIRRLRCDPIAVGLVLEHERWMPTRGHAGDAGFDLYVSRDIRISPGAFVDVPCGINGIELPEGYWAWIVGRSSTLRSKGLLVNQGIIDQGYRGPLFAGVQNISPVACDIRRGERLAQLILLPLAADKTTLTAVETVGETSRGANGFGSTGI